MKIRLSVDEDRVKTYSSLQSALSAIRFHLLDIHKWEMFETITGRFTPVFKTKKPNFIREKGFLMYSDIFR